MSPILPELSRVLGSDAAAQLAASVVAFGMIAGGFLSGRLLALIGIRSSILVSLGVFAAAGSVGALNGSVAFLVITRFVLGLAAVGFSTAAMALTTTAFFGEARSAVIGFQQAVSQVVNVVGIILAGVLAGIAGWRSPFVLLGCYGVALFLVAFFSVKSSSPTQQKPGDDQPSSTLFPAILPICALTALMGFLTVVPWTQLPFVLVDSGFDGTSTLALIGAMNFVMATAGALAYGPMTRRIGKRASFAVGLVIGTLGIAIMGKAGSLPWFYLASGFSGLGTGIYNSFVFDFGVDAAPTERKAEVAGYLFSCICGGFALNPFIAGQYQSAFGLHTGVFAIGISAMIVGLLGTLLKHSQTTSIEKTA
jgi:MFS family permease